MVYLTILLVFTASSAKIHGFCPPIIMAGLNLKICQNFVGTKFFLTFGGDKLEWGELKLYGGVIFITALALFNFFRNSQHPEKKKCFF